MNKWLKILLIVAAIIVVLFILLPIIIVMIASLVFLINPSEIGATGCTGFQQLPIGNFQISNDSLTIKITNQTGRNMSTVDIQGSFDGEEYISSKEYSGTETINANSEAYASWSGQQLEPGNHTIDLIISYNNGDFIKTATGSCRGQT
ncbi:MAG: hypothetical protein CL944_02120 [Candidatus Diapherotrites archaeon]|uniref:Uncharacterized protein n=1 Tax=Candidatus Iainarchaeum sp. TaxID=3101447 RepID=A0A2D6LQ54_9ARCH|nr:hypothetical protein [Candidatus Diapherotrites archaeon]|tara:strand:+ start:4768 stop:5211 length:444 start_codon:yes stop_codon:yes gene_type:complete